MINYWALKSEAITDWMSGLVAQKLYKPRLADGKYVLGECIDPQESCWHFINKISYANCTYLHKHLFDQISPRTPIGQFVPRRCQECWKIQLRPKNLTQLFAVEQLLLRLDLESKCGVEKRHYTPMTEHRYGAYVYNQSLDQGLRNLDMVREEVAADPDIDDDTEVILKRGCTEMDLAFPDSSSWEVTPEQNRIEDILDEKLVVDIPRARQPKHLIAKTHMIWIEWAAEIGDQEYLKYTEGIRMYPLAARYEKAEETKPDTQLGETVAFSPSGGEVPEGMGLIQTKENVK